MKKVRKTLAIIAMASCVAVSSTGCGGESVSETKETEKVNSEIETETLKNTSGETVSGHNWMNITLTKKSKKVTINSYDLQFYMNGTKYKVVKAGTATCSTPAIIKGSEIRISNCVVTDGTIKMTTNIVFYVDSCSGNKIYGTIYYGQ